MKVENRARRIVTRRCSVQCRGPAHSVLAMRPSCPIVIAAAVFASLSCADAAGPGKSTDVMPFDAATQPTFSASGVVSGAGNLAMVKVTVSVGNPDVRPRSVTFSRPCTVILHAFTSSARDGTPVFRQETLPGGCKSFAWTDTIPPGGAVTLLGELAAGTILNPPGMSPLVPGRYYFSAIVAVREVPLGNVELSAGQADIAP